MQRVLEGRSARRFALLCGVLVCLVVGLAPAAGAAPNAVVSGTVTNGTDPVAGISVTVYGVVYGNVMGTATTDVNGAYSISVAAPSNVKVAFRDAAHSYADQWNGGAVSFAAAASVPLAGGGAATVPAVLGPYAGAIAGTVTDTGANPLADISVDVVNAFYGNTVASTTTAADGTYTVAGLVPTNYRVQFTDPYGQHPTRWNGLSATFALAPNVAVASGGTAVVDVALPGAGEVTGRVTNGGRPAAGMYVLVLDPVDDALVAGALTDANGYYTVSGVEAGQHKIGFLDPLVFSDPTHSLRPQLYPSLDVVNLTLAGALAAATFLTVPDGGQLHLDAALVGAQCSMAPGTSLAGLDLTGADLSGCDLTGSDLSGAVLEATRLYGATLSGADLSGVTGTGTDLSGADLTGAALAGASLIATDFTGANLTGATLSVTTVLTGPVWSDTTCPDGTNSDGNGNTCLGHLLITPNLTVDSTADVPDETPGDGRCDDGSGACTLRAAVMEANATAGPDVIYLQSSANYHLDRAGSGEDASVTGDLDVTDPVAIVGNDATIDASGLGDRVFEVPSSPPGALTASALTITGGSGVDAGGGIFAAGGLTLADVRVEGNTAGFGGGIEAFGPTSLTDVNVGLNTATGDATSGGDGGGLWLGGSSAELTRVNAYSNTALANVTTGDAGSGGGLTAWLDTLTVTDSSLGGNFVESGTGIAKGGGADLHIGTTATLTGVQTGDNTARIGISLAVAGGTVSIENSSLTSGAPIGVGTVSGLESNRTALTLTDTEVGISPSPDAIAVDATSHSAGYLHLLRSRVFGGAEGIVATGPVSIDSSAVTNALLNGVSHQVSGDLEILNSTIANNGSGGYGNGIDQFAGTATIRFSTIAGSPVGIEVLGGTVLLESSIVAHSAGVSPAACTAPVASAGNNVIDDTTCGSAAGDLVGVDPMLDALSYASGFTPVRRPLSGSPAIDLITAPCAVATDQVGVSRPQGAGCDAGAVEQ